MDNNQTNNQMNKENKQKNGRELFYGVIAIASFIVMAVGATFAYFTATASSANSSIGTGSTTLELQYISYGSAWSHYDLIPSDTTVTEYSVEYQNDTTAKQDAESTTYLANNTLCVDDYGNSICSIYEFQVRNSANSPQTVTLNLVSETNEFSSLNAMAYELTIDDEEQYNDKTTNNGSSDPKFKTSESDMTENAIEVTDGYGNPLYNATPVYLNRKGVKKTLLKYIDTTVSESEGVVLKSSIDRLVGPVPETVRLADDITINGGETKSFAIVLYIKNANIDQTATDASKNFTGKVVVSTGDGTTGVSGTISASGTQKLQSGLQ